MQEFIVKHHDAFFTVINASTNSKKVELVPYGGGFVRTISKEVFDNEYERVTDIPNDWEPVWVNIDMEMPVKAFVRKHHLWNGWATPSFDITNLDEVKEVYFNGFAELIPYEGGFTIKELEPEYPDDGPANEPNFIINVNSKNIAVNSLIDGWCWTHLSHAVAVGIFLIYEIAKVLPKETRSSVEEYNQSNPDKPDAIFNHLTKETLMSMMQPCIDKVYSVENPEFKKPDDDESMQRLFDEVLEFTRIQYDY